MGLLSADEVTAIATKKPVYRQAWAILVPRASGSTTLDAGTIHDDLNGPECVVEPNTRDVEGYNQSMAVAGNLTSGMYRFTVKNPDGMFYPSTVNNWFYNSTGTYQASPAECQLLHNMYVKTGTTWSLLGMVAYGGKIQSVEYDDNKKTAVIEVVAEVVRLLSSQWKDSDGAEYESGIDVAGIDT